MTDEELMEEYTKCLESPAYFYNNYCLVKDANGKVSKPNPVTDEQIEAAIYVDFWQRRLRNPYDVHEQPKEIKGLIGKNKKECE